VAHVVEVSTAVFHSGAETFDVLQPLVVPLQVILSIIRIILLNILISFVTGGDVSEHH